MESMENKELRNFRNSSAFEELLAKDNEILTVFPVKFIMRCYLQLKNMLSVSDS